MTRNIVLQSSQEVSKPSDFEQHTRNDLNEKTPGVILSKIIEPFWSRPGRTELTNVPLLSTHSLGIEGRCVARGPGIAGNKSMMSLPLSISTRGRADAQQNLLIPGARIRASFPTGRSAQLASDLQKVSTASSALPNCAEF